MSAANRNKGGLGELGGVSGSFPLGVKKRSFLEDFSETLPNPPNPPEPPRLDHLCRPGGLQTHLAHLLAVRRCIKALVVSADGTVRCTTPERAAP
jgi:hypothetical protein